MAAHQTLSHNTGVAVYFAPHSPWERGINENVDGLSARSLPKGADLALFSHAQLNDIVWTLNTRPRKSLAWKAPAELFFPQRDFDFVQHWSDKIHNVALDP